MPIHVPFVRNPYNYDTAEASDESGLRCEDPSLAVQDQRDEVDINTIVRRFGLTGQLPEDVRVPTYGDFTGVSDYHSAMNAVRMAGESFMAMPAEVRSRFGNDPGNFVAFCSDPANLDEMRKLGLAVAASPAADALAASAALDSLQKAPEPAKEPPKASPKGKSAPEASEGA